MWEDKLHIGSVPMGWNDEFVRAFFVSYLRHAFVLNTYMRVCVRARLLVRQVCKYSIIT